MKEDRQVSASQVKPSQVKKKVSPPSLVCFIKEEEKSGERRKERHTKPQDIQYNLSLT